MKKEVKIILILVLAALILLIVLSAMGPRLSPAPLGYSQPEDVFNNETIYWTNMTSEESVEIKINHPGAYVYQYGYYWAGSGWARFTFDFVDAPPVYGGDWISEKAIINLNLAEKNLTINKTFLIGYTCKKHDGEWKCGCRTQDDCGYWMLQTHYSPEVPQTPPSPTFNILSGGNPVAQFDENGTIKLQGTCAVQTSCEPPEDSFVIQNSTEEIVSYIDNEGNLCIESGDCAGNSPSCDVGNPAFVITNNLNTRVITVDAAGGLCLIGSLLESSEIS